MEIFTSSVTAITGVCLLFVVAMDKSEEHGFRFAALAWAVVNLFVSIGPWL